MGFNNGYDSGYGDAKAELMPKIKALEARVAELGGASSSTNYSSGPGPNGVYVYPADTAAVAAPSSGSPVELQDGKLTKVSVTATTTSHGGWSDRDTTGANRPAPVCYPDSEFAEFDDWSIEDETALLEQTGLNPYSAHYELYGDGSGGAQLYVSGLVSGLLHAVVTAVNTADRQVTLTLYEDDRAVASETFEYEFSTPEEGMEPLVYVFGYASITDLGVAYLTGDYLSSESGPAVDDTVDLSYELELERAFTFTPVTYTYSLPSGFKLVVPAAEGGRPRRLQALLTVHGDGCPALGDCLGEAPAGTTLVYDAGVTPAAFSGQSGDSTLISFLETAPGTVTVSTLKAPASSILPEQA